VEQWLGIGNFRPTWALENTVLDYRPIRILGQLIFAYNINSYD
jgi:hypothetical protein